MPGIVARVRPRASKGITDLLLLSVSYGFSAVNPSKKSYSISGGLGVSVIQGIQHHTRARNKPEGKRRTARAARVTQHSTR